MCGIFGVIASDKIGPLEGKLDQTLEFLAKKSESRGKDSSGISLFNNSAKSIEIYKGPVPITQLIKNQLVKTAINKALSMDGLGGCRYIFGHSRLVTNGSQLNSDNNQPVVKDNIIGIHNGIIVNSDSLWMSNSLLNQIYEIDTEVFFSLIRLFYNSSKYQLGKAVSRSLNEIDGTVASAFFLNDLNKFVITTNNGSLYKIEKEKKLLYFASESFILEQMAKKYKLKKFIGNYNIEKINPGDGFIYDLDNLKSYSIHHPNSKLNQKNQKNNHLPKKININKINPDNKQLSAVIDLNYIHLSTKAKKEKDLLIYNLDNIKNLKRCTKCILPETFPFIMYDENGVCNYCKNYIGKPQKKSIDDLMNLVEPYRRNNSTPEVLLPYSGGRDSTYALHIVKNELGLDPITFTYDWGMVTDLARRNIARTCGKLGVENIIVAANIHWKRKNINKNISAWLKNPQLGMIPLFMAGDKYFFYYAYKVKKQLGIDLEIWGVNHLENTDFKTGFSGIKPRFNKKRIYSLSLSEQLKLFSFVGRNVLKSPGYINKSVFDSIGSIASRYFTPKKDYFHLFDYFPWDEKIINETIINYYDWEKAVDTESTWRIGDGTASFYNYVYVLSSGFSENDTFRSNQIREGLISREKALQLVYEENKPRYNSLKWYFEIIGIDFESTISIINRIPKSYNY